MKYILAPMFLVTFVTFSARADEQEDTGTGLMERGAELFWEGLRKEMAPSLQDLESLMANIGPSMQNFLSEMGPALADIAGKVEDWSLYEAPEILPNGDIIIRRKQPNPKSPDGDTAPSGATDI